MNRPAVEVEIVVDAKEVSTDVPSEADGAAMMAVVEDPHPATTRPTAENVARTRTGPPHEAAR